MIMNIQMFILGYLVNAVIWRIEQGHIDDIAYPAAIAVIYSLMIGIEYMIRRR